VTRPATLAEHCAKFEPVFQDLPPKLFRTDITGMHIHVDRQALSPLLLARMVDFMHNVANKEFLETVGERVLNRYCQQDPSRQFGYILQTPQFGNSRLVTLNLCKAPTVEFRLFWTPLTYAAFRKNLEFVSALINYYRTGSSLFTPKQSRTWVNFVAHLKENNHSKTPARNPQHYLAAHLREKGVM
jgi:hypothetical protein